MLNELVLSATCSIWWPCNLPVHQVLKNYHSIDLQFKQVQQHHQIRYSEIPCSSNCWHLATAPLKLLPMRPKFWDCIAICLLISQASRTPLKLMAPFMWFKTITKCVNMLTTTSSWSGHWTHDQPFIQEFRLLCFTPEQGCKTYWASVQFFSFISLDSLNSLQHQKLIFCPNKQGRLQESDLICTQMSYWYALRGVVSATEIASILPPQQAHKQLCSGFLWTELIHTDIPSPNVAGRGLFRRPWPFAAQPPWRIEFSQSCRICVSRQRAIVTSQWICAKTISCWKGVFE